MTRPRPTRLTTDLPAQQVARPGIDLLALAIRHAVVLRIAYLVCIGIATLLRVGFDPDPAHVLLRLQRAVAPLWNFKDVVDAVRNVALFAGWGATWVLTSRAPTTGRDIARATLLGLLASVAVEGAQLFSPARVSNILDVTTNTLGALLGAGALWLLERRAANDMRRGTMLGIPAWISAGAMLTTAASLAFAPSSRIALIIDWSATPFARQRMVEASPAVALPWPALVTDGCAWVLAGITVAIAVSDRTGRIRFRQLLGWLLIAPAVLVGVHAGRAYAGLQREEHTLFVQGASFTIGLVAALLALPYWRDRVKARSVRAAQLGIAVALFGALMAWSPASWAALPGATPALSWRQLIPMMSLFQRHDMSSVFLVLQKAGIGALIGAALAARKRVGVPWPGLRAALLYAILLEVGQVLVPGRYPDVTDIMITSAAAGLVAVLAARSGRDAPSDTQMPGRDLNGRASAGRF